MEFFGTHLKRADAKFRISVPADFRRRMEAAGEHRLILTRALTDHSITVYPIEQWRQRAALITKLAQTHKAVAIVKKLQFASAAEVVPDGHGRVLIPQNLRKHAGIESASEVAVVGFGTTFGIYELHRWHEAEAAAEALLPTMMDLLAEAGL